MALPSISASFSQSTKDIGILSNYIYNAGSLQSQHQYLIAEVVMLRLFGIFENAVQHIAYKLACGAPYRNGAKPVVLTPCKNILDAHHKMLSYGRRKPLPYLKWTTSPYINDSIKFVLDPTDTFYAKILSYGSTLDEMRIVRNQIAHRTASTKSSFDTVLISRYGANPRLSMGAFLTSTSRHTPSNITRYVLEMSIILNDITYG
jgi:hypothetical protein